MRTTGTTRRPVTEPATVTPITASKGGRPRLEPTEITLEIKEGANLRRYRESAGFGSAAFAKALDISQPTLSNYESGFKRIPDSRIEQIAHVLQVKPWELRLIQTLPFVLKAS